MMCRSVYHKDQELAENYENRYFVDTSPILQ